MPPFLFNILFVTKAISFFFSINQANRHFWSKLLFHIQQHQQGGGDPNNPGSTPTRPSSVTLPQLLPGAPEMKRVKYISNLRHHSSALEAVVAAPRWLIVLKDKYGEYSQIYELFIFKIKKEAKK